MYSIQDIIDIATSESEYHKTKATQYNAIRNPPIKVINRTQLDKPVKDVDATLNAHS